MYLEDFSNLEDVLQEFAVNTKEYDNINILLAEYYTPDWEGYAFVLFEQNGKLYEVNGSHCSCYGLEGQFIPEEVSVEELRHRMITGNLGCGYQGNFADELRKILNKWEA